MNEIISHPINGQIVNQRAEDGYINATAMCAAARKRFNDYSALGSTGAFLEALSSDTRISVSQLVVSKRGNSKAFTQGTWVHPQVAIHLAQWLSPEFAVQVSRWVFQWVNNLTKEAPTDPVAQRTASIVAYVINNLNRVEAMAAHVGAPDPQSSLLWNWIYKQLESINHLDEPNRLETLESLSQALERRHNVSTNILDEPVMVAQSMILEYIRAVPREISRSALSNAHRGIRSSEMTALLDNLCEAGLVVRRYKQTAGRPAEMLSTP